MFSQKPNFLILLVLIILITANTTQAQFCKIASKIEGTYTKNELNILSKQITNYFEYYKSGDLSGIAGLIDKKNKKSVINFLTEKNSSKEIKERYSNIETFCIDKLTIFDGSVYALANGNVRYGSKSKKKDEKIFFYINREGDEFSFTDLMFNKYDIYEIKIEEPIDDEPTKLNEKLN